MEFVLQNTHPSWRTIEPVVDEPHDCVVQSCTCMERGASWSKSLKERIHGSAPSTIINIS